MIPLPGIRDKGGAQQLGARRAGETGPYGPWVPEGDDEDGPVFGGVPEKPTEDGLDDEQHDQDHDAPDCFR